MKGFSLLETIVGIAILILGILGPLSLASYTLSRASLSENQIIAYFLAEEALEFVINKRDSNVFAGNDWLDGLKGGGLGCETGNGCYIDITTGIIDRCDGGGICPFVRRNSDTGLYNHQPPSSTNADTIFRRRVLLKDSPDNDDERRLEVIVSWMDPYSTDFRFVNHIFKKRELGVSESLLSPSLLLRESHFQEK